jgi:peptide/nickel transport system permease protein
MMDRELLLAGSPQQQTGQMAAPDEPIARSNWRLFWRRFRRHKLAMISAFVLLALIVVCFGAHWIAPYPKNKQDLLLGPTQPSGKHWFGTDELGRDQLTEILYAGQTSLKIGLAVALLSTLLGVVVGSVAGFYGRWVDQGLSRTTDLFLIVPDIAALAVLLSVFGGTPGVVILVLAVLGWTYVARVLRGEVLAVKEKEFVEAARASGASDRRIIVRHILPNCVGSIIVNMTLAVAAAIVTESTLSFLGFGVAPPATSWGSMLNQYQDALQANRLYLLFFPLLFLIVTVLCVSFIGDGFRDAFDTRRRT